MQTAQKRGGWQNARRFASLMMEAVPAARAAVKGDRAHWGLNGSVSFFPVNGGVLVVAEIFGLPGSGGGAGGRNGVFGFHIHGGGACTGGAADPFQNTNGHFNPQEAAHPWHAGDMPPLFGSSGYAYLAFFTNRFTVSEILGRTVVIHDMPDDFTTQPAGNAGMKIACGVIQAIRR